MKRSNAMEQAMENQSLRDRIIARFDDMAPQLQQAARYILDHPQETALISMRALARHAGVQPATMTRLAKFLGLSGYEEIRAHHAEAIRLKADGFAARAQQAGLQGGGEGMARAMLEGLSVQIARLCEPQSLERLSALADRLATARRIYVLGLRSCHSVAWHFHYVMTLFSERTIHLDGPGGTLGDGLIRAQKEDVLLIFSFSPYAARGLELAGFARERGVGVLAITDSAVSPLVGLSDQAVFCATESPSFFHTLAPALAVSEVLCALLASQERSAALEALQRTDRHLLALDTFANTMPRRKI